MYMLECADGSYYTGSTNNLERRLADHQTGEGANHTKVRLPVKLIYCEEYPRIQDAFHREKQVQGWSRKKKEALINGNSNLLPELAKAYRDLEKGGYENLNHPELSEGTRKQLFPPIHSFCTVSNHYFFADVRVNDPDVLPIGLCFKPLDWFFPMMKGEIKRPPVNRHCDR